MYMADQRAFLIGVNIRLKVLMRIGISKIMIHFPQDHAMKKNESMEIALTPTV